MFYDQSNRFAALNINNHETLPVQESLINSRDYWSVIYDNPDNARFYRSIHKLENELRSVY